MMAVAYIAKVRILEQITTYRMPFLFLQSCCLYRKGKNFRANHNVLYLCIEYHSLLLISQR